MPADSQVRLVRMLAASGTMRFDPSDMLAVIDGRLDRHGIDYGYIAELLALRGVHVLPEQAYHTPLTDLEAALAAPRAEEPITFDDAADLIEKARDWRYSAEWLGKRDRAAPRAEGLDVERLGEALRNTGIAETYEGHPWNPATIRRVTESIAAEYARLSRPSDERVPEEER